MHIDLEVGNLPSQGIPVHPEVVGGAAQVAFVVAQGCSEERASEFPNRFGVEDSSAAHFLGKTYEQFMHMNTPTNERHSALKPSAYS
jgi:hypothetical protein